MLDATKSDEQRRLLEIELDAVGIRLNKQKPDVVFKRKTTGGSVDFVNVVFVDLINLCWLYQNHCELPLIFLTSDQLLTFTEV
jgi:hypothetical protein